MPMAGRFPRLCVCLLAAIAVSGGEIVFHVRSAAGAGGDGTREKPFNTIWAAREKIKTAFRDGLVPDGTDAVISFAPGVHRLGAGISLSAADSGRSGRSRVIWRAQESGKTVFTREAPIAFKRIRPLAADDPNFLRFPSKSRARMRCVDLEKDFPNGLPPMPDISEHFPFPIVPMADRVPLVCARWPNTGEYATFDAPKDTGIKDDKFTEKHETHPGAFYFDDPRMRMWRFDEGVRFAGYWNVDWHCHYARAAGVETDGGRTAIRLAAEIPTGICVAGRKAKPRRFYAYDIPEELDAPGEYWIDRARRRFYFIPPDGFSAGSELQLARSAPFVVTGKGVSHVVFEGIAFAGFGGDGLQVAGNDIAFVSCTFEGVGGTALQLTGNGNLVRGCTFRHIGRGAMDVRGGDRLSLTPARTVVEGCKVTDWAIFQRCYAGGLHIGGCGITVRGNEFWNAPHSAVFVSGNDHLIESNVVHHVLLDTGDCGAYYMGRDRSQQGTVMRWNFTHDLGRADFAPGDAMGFYFDDCDCGKAVQSNVFLRVSRGIMIGGGRDHPVTGNVFIDCRLGMSIDSRGLGWATNLIDVAPSWRLQEKCERMRYREEPWRSRYPRLAGILEDDPRQPKYNPIDGNLFIACAKTVRLEDGKHRVMDGVFTAKDNLVVPRKEGTEPLDPRIAEGFRNVTLDEASRFFPFVRDFGLQDLRHICR